MATKKKKVGRPRKLTEKAVEAELHKTLGQITIAATNLGVVYNTVKRVLDESEKCREIVEHYRQLRVDKAELALEKAIQDGEPWAVSLTLKTQGKDRGYVERQEIEPIGKVNVTVTRK